MTSRLFEKYLQKVSEAWNLQTPRLFIRFALEKIAEHWNDKNVFIVEAPTGYGKSVISATISLYSIAEEFKAIICYPLRALIEDQYDVFTGRKIGKKPVCDEKLVGMRYMHHLDSRYLIKPITLTTIDTFALTLFGIAPEDFEKALKAYEGISFSFGHYMFSWASALLSNVILDEVHLLADSTKSLNFLIALLKTAIRFNQKIILMTATLPKALKNTIVDFLQGDLDRILFITFSKDSDFGCNYFDEDFVKERTSKEYDVEIYALRESEKYVKLIELLKKYCNEFKRVIVVFNTVEDAINFYLTAKYNEEISKTFDKILLIHSRFTESDRRKKNEELKNLSSSYLIIATQVIEAGIDISSDFFITEIAPANSLIQRLGRFLRYDEKRGKVIVWYEVDDGDLKLTISLNRKARNVKWICVNTENDEIFKKCLEVLCRDFKDVNFRKLSEWRGRKDRLTVATPMYKVYDYELTLKTLEWFKKHKINVHIPESVEGYRNLLNCIYSQKDFSVNTEMIEKLLKIHDHLENPENAVELLIKLEGSFVRDGYQINVISLENARDFVGKDEKELNKLISKFCVPISVRVLKSLDVMGFLYVNEDGKIAFEERKFLPNLKELFRGIWLDVEKKFVSPIAFVAKIVYAKEVGLRVTKNDLCF